VTAPWVDPDSHGRIWAPRSAADWRLILEEYGGTRPTPLSAILDVVRRSGCRTIVDENRYVDLDYRTEYSKFWSQRFDELPAYARRLHFFSIELDDDDLHKIPNETGYLGYSVLKPPQFGRVGRTVLAPPDDLATKPELSLARVDDRVNVFGSVQSISGIPFYQQDGEYIRCAHAAAWVCHYCAWRRGLVGRRASGDLAEMVPDILSEHRPLPSKGMHALQLQAVFNGYGQPALLYSLDDLPTVSGVKEVEAKKDAEGVQLPGGCWDVRLFSIICRYLNSGFPVLIGTREHAFVLVGWYRESGLIRFIACDDQQGPYEVIDNPFTDHNPPRAAPWRLMMVPLPPKVLLSGEMAENQAHKEFRRFKFIPGAPIPWKRIGDGLETSKDQVAPISLRTVLKPGSDYKSALAEQDRPDAAVRAMRLARLPHYVWVVEAQDRNLRGAGEPCVLAELVLDSTSHDREPRVDALSAPGLTLVFPPGGGQYEDIATGVTKPWKSQLVPG
jgi:hypothetical protein